MIENINLKIDTNAPNGGLNFTVAVTVVQWNARLYKVVMVMDVTWTDGTYGTPSLVVKFNYILWLSYYMLFTCNYMLRFHNYMLMFHYYMFFLCNYMLWLYDYMVKNYMMCRYKPERHNKNLKKWRLKWMKYMGSQSWQKSIFCNIRK